jgi:hypothetical protein
MSSLWVGFWVSKISFPNAVSDSSSLTGRRLEEDNGGEGLGGDDNEDYDIDSDVDEHRRLREQEAASRRSLATTIPNPEPATIKEATDGTGNKMLLVNNDEVIRFRVRTNAVESPGQSFSWGDCTW